LKVVLETAVQYGRERSGRTARAIANTLRRRFFPCETPEARLWRAMERLSANGTDYPNYRTLVRERWESYHRERQELADFDAWIVGAAESLAQYGPGTLRMVKSLARDCCATSFRRNTLQSGLGEILKGIEKVSCHFDYRSTVRFAEEAHELLAGTGHWQAFKPKGYRQTDGFRELVNFMARFAAERPDDAYGLVCKTPALLKETGGVIHRFAGRVAGQYGLGGSPSCEGPAGSYVKSESTGGCNESEV
jgi:hypothetical protein